MTKRADQLDRIEQALAGIREIQSAISAALDPDVKGSMAAQLIAEAKAARSSSEAAFASVQALAAYVTAKPGLGELAGAVATNTEAIRAVHAAVRAMPAAVPAVQVPAPGGSAGTSGGMPPRGKGAGKGDGPC